ITRLGGAPQVFASRHPEFLRPVTTQRDMLPGSIRMIIGLVPDICSSRIRADRAGLRALFQQLRHARVLWNQRLDAFQKFERLLVFASTNCRLNDGNLLVSLLDLLRAFLLMPLSLNFSRGPLIQTCACGDDSGQGAKTGRRANRNAFAAAEFSSTIKD